MSGTDRETRPLATRSLIEQIFRAIHSLLPGQAQVVGPGPIFYPDRTRDQKGQSYSGFRDHVGKPPFAAGRFEVGASHPLDRTLVRKVNAQPRADQVDVMLRSQRVTPNSLSLDWVVIREL